LTPPPLLDVRQLAAARGNATLFRDLGFRLESGDVMLVQGRNGTGKTTLLRILAGLTSMVDGVVAWCGERMVPLDERLRTAVAFVGHAPAIKDELSAAENLAALLALSGEAADPDRVVAALGTAGLDARRELPARWLSQGQRRRIGLARLALTRRPLWILDEPGTALDASAFAWLGELINAHANAGGIVVAATHQPLPMPARRIATLTLG
jgi:heme exporter protein A